MFEEEILYSEEQGYVSTYQDSSLGTMITVKLSNWSPSEYKRYLLIWGNILNKFKEKGIDTLFALCETEKNAKFTEEFGFIFTGYLAECADGIQRKLMKLEIKE